MRECLDDGSDVVVLDGPGQAPKLVAPNPKNPDNFATQKDKKRKTEMADDLQHK